jgi:putative transposase
MRGPKPPRVALTADERQGLETLVRRHTTAPQVALRARLTLAAADGLHNVQIAHHLGVDVDPGRLWRQRWLSLQAVTLEDLSVEAR